MWTLLTSVWVVEVSLLLNRQGVIVACKQLQHLEPVHTPSLVGRAGGGGGGGGVKNIVIVTHSSPHTVQRHHLVRITL